MAAVAKIGPVGISTAAPENVSEARSEVKKR